MSSISPDFSTLPQGLRERVNTYWSQWQLNNQQTGAELAEPIIETLPLVWACSDFVAKTCTLNHELFTELLNSGDLLRPYLPGELRQRLNQSKTAADEQVLYKNLRCIRKREALRIAWRDLAGWGDLDEVMGTQSELADGCIQIALDFLYDNACQQRGTPRDRQGNAVYLSVLGLGKLGGGELNFSSDIDLIFAYRSDGETDSPRSLSNHEFFVKLSTRLISALEKITEDGQVFRVDMRLRPNGNSGPICLSFDATEQYYQVHGRDWERYALIKARSVAGDIGAGEQLLNRLKPFVYRKYLDFGAFQAIRDMKTMIDREIERKQVQGNIKLGQGGIREIEFITQSLQLIRGGRETELQSNRIQSVIDQLIAIRAIDQQTADELRQSYIFLRNLEHRLQMLADEQTHNLPSQPVPQLQTALAMGYPDWASLSEKIKQITTTVHHHFQHILSEREQRDDAPEILNDVWSTRLESEAAIKTLTQAGFENVEKTFEHIKQSRQGKLYHAHTKLGRQRLDRLMPQIIQLAGQATNPDETLSRMIQFVESVGRRSTYLILLIENPIALKQLVRLCSASAWVSNWISKYPLLLEELLMPISEDDTSADSFLQELKEELRTRTKGIDPQDLEAHMELFREIHHAYMLHVAAIDLSKQIQPEGVSIRLGYIAETLLNAIVDYCTQTLQSSIGAPGNDDPDLQPGFGIVAYGKLGSHELGYNSDLDLVFIHHNSPAQQLTLGGKRSVSNEQYYGRLAQKILHAITTRTASGALYEIDSRLRPSGRSGPLVTSLSAFKSYQRDHAWTWEHQALVRARMICGPESLHQEFEAARKEILTSERDPQQLHDDVREMRAKMRANNDRSDEAHFDLKQGEGGMIDIEFIVQYYVLQWAYKYPNLVTLQSNLELIGQLGELGLVIENDANQLQRAYREYLSIDHRNKLAEQEPLIEADRLMNERKLVTRLWKETFN